VRNGKEIDNPMRSKTFGSFIKEKRLEKDMSLRTFCKKIDYDASNWSKIERGLLSPPSEEKKLANIADLLDIKIGSDEWQALKDRANIDIGIIPPDLLSDEEVLKALPIFFRTLRNEKPSKEELEKLVKKVKRGM
jgi:transcriptional regulator with XRE-family HTH domain